MKANGRGRTSERLARLEGAYEHLATKADIADLRGSMRVWIAALALLNIVLRFVGESKSQDVHFITPPKEK